MKFTNNGRIAVRAATITAGLLLSSGAAFSMSPLAQSDQGGSGMQAGATPEAKSSGRFGSMDTDKDGTVSREEAAAFHATQFQKMDANKDGRLSREESMAMMMGMHGGGCCMNMMEGDGMKGMMGADGMMNMKGCEGMHRDRD